MLTSSTKKSPVSLRSIRAEKSYGHYIWNKEQAYEGELFRGSLHGEGTYKWKDLAVYEGGFYSNYKEGYALMSFPDNTSFEGLFIRNQRFGPGVFTYSNGRQDVGYWMGRKLVRLSRTVDYIVPRLAPTSAAKIKLLQFRRFVQINEDPDSVSEIPHICKCCPDFLSSPYSRVIHDPRSIFFEKNAFQNTYFLNSTNVREETSTESVHRLSWNQDVDQLNEGRSATVSPVPSHCLCQDKEFLMNYQQSDFVDVCEVEAQGETEMGILAYFRQYALKEGLGGSDEKLITEDLPREVENSLKPIKILAWNRNELFVQMLQEIFRYREFEGKLSFNIAKLMLGVRTAFRKTGEKEKECLEFLRTCAVGPPHLLKSMLCDYDISEELTDGRGNNSVMFAAATDQHDIIDTLLDYGANVNSFNDENLTPLNMCLLRRLALAFDLVNWESAFLPQEIEQNADDEYEEEELQKRISIPSLDRIFGDGSSFYENKYQLSSEIFQENETLLAKHISELHSKSQSLMEMRRTTEKTETTGSLSIKALGRALTKNKQKLQQEKEEYKKSVDKSKKTPYFFKLAPVEKGVMRIKLKSGQYKTVSREDEEKACEEDDSGLDDVKSKIQEVDKTIEKLLMRGADPNISEVPKPSIHLGVYTKSLKIVNLLQLYGANLNAKLYPNEGLLTPLHLVVLLEPCSENVSICKFLLNCGASAEEKTLPGFIFYEGEQEYLDPTEGRTPLQLLCMRPDAEYADPDGYLTEMGLLLSRQCKRTSLYNGHSYLSLAMYFGNLKLFKAMLCSNLFDPNAKLGKDRGSLLHVLVSKEFQKKSKFEKSSRIFDDIKKAGGNLVKQVGGHFIDFGYREVQEEKNFRRVSSVEKREPRKRSLQKPKVTEQDFLPDHEKFLKYVTGRIKKDEEAVIIPEEKKIEVEIEKPEVEIIEVEGEEEKIIPKVKPEVKEKKISKKEEISNKNKGPVRKKVLIAGTGDSVTVVEKKEQVIPKGVMKTEHKPVEHIHFEGGKSGEEESPEKKQESTNELNEEPKKSSVTLFWVKTDAPTFKDINDGSLSVEKKVKRENAKNRQKGKREDKNLKGEEQPKETKKSEVKLRSKSFVRSLGGRQIGSLESFPENLRQSILKLLGNYSNLDVNELFLPYVVLRDGDLYYGFKRKSSWGKEQYSLV